MHDMNEKVSILNLEAENCDEDKIEVFALPPSASPELSFDTNTSSL